MTWFRHLAMIVSLALAGSAGVGAGSTNPRLVSNDGTAFLQGEGVEAQIVSIELPAGTYALIAKGSFLTQADNKGARCSLVAGGDDVLDTIYVDGGQSPFTLLGVVTLATADAVAIVCDTFAVNASVFEPKILATANPSIRSTG